jgi:hypothetical protein
MERRDLFKTVAAATSAPLGEAAQTQAHALATAAVSKPSVFDNNNPGINLLLRDRDVISTLYQAVGIGFSKLNKGGCVPATVGWCRHQTHG